MAVGATVEPDAGFDARATAGGMRQLFSEMLRLAPGLAEATFVEVRAGLRPVSADDAPVLGRPPGLGQRVRVHGPRGQRAAARPVQRASRGRSRGRADPTDGHRPVPARPVRGRRGPAHSLDLVFADLLAHPGVTERVELRSRFGFMAIHGGSLERGTAEIAVEAAARSGASLYTVEQPEDLRWHLPSHLVIPEGSPALAGFLDHVDLVVSVHGLRTRWRTGRACCSAARTASSPRGSPVVLRAGLDGYEIVDDLDAIPEGLRGLHPENPVNRTRGGGVQLELPPRVRGLGPKGSSNHVEALVDALAQAAA